jgi:hypothetical protein
LLGALPAAQPASAVVAASSKTASTREPARRKMDDASHIMEGSDIVKTH